MLHPSPFAYSLLSNDGESNKGEGLAITYVGISILLVENGFTISLEVRIELRFGGWWVWGEQETLGYNDEGNKNKENKENKGGWGGNKNKGNKGNKEDKVVRKEKEQNADDDSNGNKTKKIGVFCCYPQSIFWQHVAKFTWSISVT